MGLLDGGIARAFGGIFGALYPDALLHVPTRAETQGGSVTEARTGDAGQPEAMTVKAQRDAVTATMREAEGYEEKDVRFIILTRTAEYELPELPQGCHLTWPKLGGTRYSLQGPAALDGAASHYEVRGRPVRSAPLP
jgi:hypothetical protein